MFLCTPRTGGTQYIGVPTEIYYIITHVCTCCTKHGVYEGGYIRHRPKQSSQHVPHMEALHHRPSLQSSLVNSRGQEPHRNDDPISFQVRACGTNCLPNMASLGGGWRCNSKYAQSGATEEAACTLPSRPWPAVRHNTSHIWWLPWLLN